jgi:uncharacterized protein
MSHHAYRLKQTYIGQLKRGTDLLTGISDYIIKNKISIGEVRGLGAVSKAVVMYFNQQTEEYESITFDEQLEILSLYGNISIKEYDPFPHLHITLGNRKGEAFGGHLAEGTIVYVAELMIHEFEGSKLARERDEKTGLYLWDYRRELIV